MNGGFILEGRYVGNHATKMLRQIDFNQINVNQGGFLQDFIRARNNGFLAQPAGKGFVAAYDPSIAGSQPLTFFPQLPAGGSLTNSAVTTPLRSGAAATSKIECMMPWRPFRQMPRSHTSSTTLLRSSYPLSLAV